jgi:hypothetical protein
MSIKHATEIGITMPVCGGLGSIFVAASLALFGISFTEQVGSSLINVKLTSAFAILVFLIFFAYSQHVQPWITLSIDRMKRIEDELRKMDFDIEVHHVIDEYDVRRKAGRRDYRRLWTKTGADIMKLIVVTVLGAWIFRWLISLLEFFNFI